MRSVLFFVLASALGVACSAYGDELLMVQLRRSTSSPTADQWRAELSNAEKTIASKHEDWHRERHETALLHGEAAPHMSDRVLELHAKAREARAKAEALALTFEEKAAVANAKASALARKLEENAEAARAAAIEATERLEDKKVEVQAKKDKWMMMMNARPGHPQHHRSMISADTKPLGVVGHVSRPMRSAHSLSATSVEAGVDDMLEQLNDMIHKENRPDEKEKSKTQEAEKEEKPEKQEVEEATNKAEESTLSKTWGSIKSALGLDTPQDQNEEATENKQQKVDPSVSLELLRDAKPAEEEKVQSLKEIPEHTIATLKDVVDIATNYKEHFHTYSDTMAQASGHLADEFNKQRLLINDMKHEVAHLIEKRKDEKAKLLAQLEEFKNRTLDKFTELQLHDQELESKNHDLTTKNGHLTTKLEAEKKKKEVLMHELQKMATLFKQQSGQVQDIITQRKKHLETEVSSTLQDALDVVGQEHLGEAPPAESKNPVEPGKPQEVFSKASLLDSAKVETTTLVLR